jgi:hypothetical protein
VIKIKEIASLCVLFLLSNLTPFTLERKSKSDFGCNKPISTTPCRQIAARRFCFMERKDQTHGTGTVEQTNGSHR